MEPSDRRKAVALGEQGVQEDFRFFHRLDGDAGYSLVAQIRHLIDVGVPALAAFRRRVGARRRRQNEAVVASKSQVLRRGLDLMAKASAIGETIADHLGRGGCAQIMGADGGVIDEKIGQGAAKRIGGFLVGCADALLDFEISVFYHFTSVSCEIGWRVRMARSSGRASTDSEL